MQLNVFLKNVSKIRLLEKITYSHTGCEIEKIQAHLIHNKVNQLSYFIKYEISLIFK